MNAAHASLGGQVMGIVRYYVWLMVGNEERYTVKTAEHAMAERIGVLLPGILASVAGCHDALTDVHGSTRTQNSDQHMLYSTRMQRTQSRHAATEFQCSSTLPFNCSSYSRQRCHMFRTCSTTASRQIRLLPAHKTCTSN